MQILIFLSKVLISLVIDVREEKSLSKHYRKSQLRRKARQLQ